MATENVATDVLHTAQAAGLSPSVQMVLVIFGLLLLLAAPMALLLRDWRKKGKEDDIEGRNGDLEHGLYKHLSEQVSILTVRLDKVHDEYNAMVRQNAELEGRIKALEGYEKMVEVLRRELEGKNVTILARDAQINQMIADIRLRDEKIAELQHRLGQLEIRLENDETRWRGEKK